MAPPRLIPHDDVILAEAERHSTQQDLATSLGVADNTLSKHLSKNPELKARVLHILAENRGRVEATQGIRTETSEPQPQGKRPIDPNADAVKDLAQKRGISLAHWVPVFAQAREYPQVVASGQVEVMEYIRVDFKPLTGSTVLNVAPPPKVRKVTPLKPRKGEPEIVALLSCDQAPFHDERVHEMLCGWLSMVQPHRVLHLGDLLDYPTVSKYKTNPQYRANVEECHVAGHRLLLERTQASPHSEWSLLPGNHDHRLPDYLRGGMPADIADLAPVGERDPWWHPRRMLHLEALGVQYVDPVAGMWERAQVQLTPTLVARHGWRTGKAVAARDTARELGVSVFCGHTHRQCIAPVTVGRDGVEHLLWAMEVGCLCEIQGGLGYVPGIADWQQGWGVAAIWPDGTFTPELAQVIDGAVRWRGQRLSTRQLKVAA